LKLNYLSQEMFDSRQALRPQSCFMEVSDILSRGHLGLVRESLIDRAWRLKNTAEFWHPVKNCMSGFPDGPRSLIKLYAGAVLYKLIAGIRNFSQGILG